MKRFIALLALLVAAQTTALAELQIVATGHRGVDSFKRLSEYFTNRENPGRYAIFRSQPDQRDGFYISLAAEDRLALEAVATIRLRFIRAGTQEVNTIDIPANGAIRKRRLLIGLTGGEWTDTNVLPVAWKVELLDANGRVAEQAESFLWADPSVEAL